MGSGIRGILPIGQLTGILHNVTIGMEGRIRLQMYNCTKRARILTAKLSLVGIVLEEGTKVIYEEYSQLGMEIYDQDDIGPNNEKES